MGRGNYDEFGSTSASTQWFLMVTIAAQIVGIVAFILIAVLLGQYQGGFGWGDPSKVFNYHPLFMTLGMVFLYGDSILVYRVFYDVKKIRVKVLHASLLAGSLIFASVGLAAVFESHGGSHSKGQNFKSLHSWTGITTITLFGLQWISGFVAFLFPGLNENLRTAYMPSHKLWGKIIFMLAIGTVLMGISEYSVFNHYLIDPNSITQRNILNVFGIFVMTFAIIVIYLTGNPGFQRPAETEAQHIPLNDD